MRGPLAGLGDGAAAEAIRQEASPGLRLRTQTHRPPQGLPPPARAHCACVYRHPGSTNTRTHGPEQGVCSGAAGPAGAAPRPLGPGPNATGRARAGVRGRRSRAHVRPSGPQSLLPAPARPAPLLLASPGTGR